jgi:hypothetical protein
VKIKPSRTSLPVLRRVQAIPTLQFLTTFEV